MLERECDHPLADTWHAECTLITSMWEPERGRPVVWLLAAERIYVDPVRGGGAAYGSSVSGRKRDV